MYEAFLRGVPLFSTLTTGELLTIADALQPVRACAWWRTATNVAAAGGATPAAAHHRAL